MAHEINYITTPLYYVNDTPHIGHAYTTVVADVLHRYNKLFGRESFLLTGTDEHGQKVQEAATKRGMTPQAHCDDLVVQYQNIWKELNISHDIFMRTTYGYHKEVVQKCLQELFDKGDIYSNEYEGWYSVSEEIFYQEKDLVNGKSPIGKEVTLVKEKNYFFKMSKYQDALVKHIESNPHFIRPENRRNEILGFLRQPLHDLCISRPKSRLQWGIEIPFDRDYVTYVWFDALLNYASAIGYKQGPEKEKQFAKLWPHCVHLLGKDIVTTHSVYWTTMLLALGAGLPKTIFAHGWWLTESGGKMSKSEGTVVKPLDMKDIVGVEGLRYFLTRDIYFGNDAAFSQELVVSRVNSELANNLGNLLSRTTNLIQKYFEGKAPKMTDSLSETKALRAVATQTAELVQKSIDTMAPNLAVGHVVDMLNEANKYLETIAPWKCAKEDLAKAGESLIAGLECLRIAAILLSPVMPQKTAELLRTIGWQKAPTLADAKLWGAISEGTTVEKASPLFPRI